MRRALALASLFAALGSIAVPAMAQAPQCVLEPAAPPAVETPSAHDRPEPEQSAYIHQQAHENRYWFDYLNAGLTLLFSGVVALFTGLLYCVTNRTLVETRKAADAAKDAADAAIAGQRAYLVVTAVEFKRDDGAPSVGPGGYWAIFVVTNYGKTPGFITSIRSAFEFEPDFDFGKVKIRKERNVRHVVPPDKDHRHFVRGHLDKAQFDALRNRDGPFFALAIDYRYDFVIGGSDGEQVAGEVAVWDEKTGPQFLYYRDMGLPDPT